MKLRTVQLRIIKTGIIAKLQLSLITFKLKNIDYWIESFKPDQFFLNYLNNCIEFDNIEIENNVMVFFLNKKEIKKVRV